MMQQKEKPRDWRELRWGTIISVALHVVIGGILLYQLPMPDFTPPEEETVSVEMVPPPPEEKAEEPPEEKKEQPPPPPAQEEQQQEQPPAQPAADKVPIPVLRPVYEFGEKATGSADAKEGDAAAAEAAKPPPEKAVETKPVEPEKTAEADKKPDIEILTAKTAADLADAVEPLPETAEAKPEKSEVIEPEPEKKAVTADIPEAKKLFSEKVSEDPIAREAMSNLSRGQRVARLCSSELYSQLKNGSPSYNAELVPSFELPKGTVLKVPNAAFRAKNRWYDLAFRCEVDGEAMSIRSFGFEVGAEVPKSQWRKRGFPSS